MHRYVSKILPGALISFGALVGLSITPASATKTCKFMFSQATGQFPELEPPHNIVIDQTNGFFINCNLLFNATPHPQNFSGTCRSNKNVKGDVADAFLNVGRFHMEVKWDGGATGVYTGSVDGDGILQDGRTFDKAHPGNFGVYTINVPFACSTHQ